MLRSRIVPFAAVALVPFFSVAETTPRAAPVASRPVVPAYGQLPLSFVANHGQTDARAAFIAHGKGYTLFLSPTETVFVAQPSPPGPTPASRLRALHGGARAGQRGADEARQTVVRMRLLGADASAEMAGEQQTSRVNYLFGSDRSGWRTDVPAYARVRSRMVYPGIDVLFYGNGQRFEYDFVVAPGADPRAIRLGFDGIIDGDERAAISIDSDGDLVLRTATGDLRLRRPLAYQEVDGMKRPVEARYVLRPVPAPTPEARPEVSLDVAPYDARWPLVIDPVLDYATYLGGSGNDAAMAIAVDSSGSTYVAGYTESPDFPASAGSPPAVGARKAFVAKIDPTGSTLLYATYLGGDGDDTATGIAVDSAGNVYVAGLTESSNFPVVNAFQTDQGGTDAFVTKLDSSGANILYSTYLGSSGTDVALGIAVDGPGRIYVTGYTESAEFPRRSAFQRFAGNADAFVAKLDPNLSGAASRIYSTPLGGADRDEGHAIAVDSQGHAYVTGFTDSAPFPTQNAYKKDQPGRDAFVVKLAPAGNALRFSTYLGGSGTDMGLGIAVDTAGGVYVTGYTGSTDFPRSGAYQSALAGTTDAFVTRFDSAGLLTYSTYLGGSGTDAGVGIAVGADNAVYVTGSTDGDDFPVFNPAQTVQGGRDAFVVKLQPGAATPLAYSTYVGGGGTDEAYGIALDAQGNAYIAGLTQSSDFPSISALGTTLGGSQDAFVVKVSASGSGADVVVSSLAGVAEAGTTVTVTDTTKNNGTLDVAGTTTRFYVSSDPALDAHDVLLGSRPVPALSAGETSTASTTLTIPSAVAAGSYFLIAQADAENVVSESREDNNTGSTAFTVGPDMIVAPLTAPAQGGAGLPITIADTTVNQGPRASVASSTAFYLSSDAILDASDILLGRRTVPVLAPGASSSGSTTVTVPTGITAGAYVVIAKADDDSVNAEANETNNTVASNSVSIGPDLIVSAIFAPASGGPGSPIVVSNTMKNQGAGQAGASTTKFYLSSDSTLDAADVLLGNRAVPALASGAISVESTSLTLPASTPIGSFVVIAVADADGAVAEANETNNSAASNSAAIGSDLLVTSVSAPGSASPGAAITVTDITKNQSAAPAGASTTRFYVSTDTVLDDGDAVLGSRAVPALAGGAQNAGTTSVTIPATTGGQFYIIAKANADGAVAESDTANNTAVSGQVKVGSDLVVALTSAPTTAGPGSVIAVTDTTRNLGAAAAAASTTRFYLSTDALVDAADVPLGDRAIGSLPAGDGLSTATTSLTIPPGTAAGNYFIIAKSDADGLVVEMDEANNTAARAIAIGADLTVSDVSAPPQAGSGLTIAITDTTLNGSQGAAAASTTRFYLSTDTSFDASDVLLGSRLVPALAGGASSTATTTLPIPPGTSPGRHFVIARADGADAIVESNEANNVRASGEIKIGPDLAVDALEAPVSGAPGGPVSVSDTIINRGGGQAGAFSVRFYFSTDAVLDVADVQLGSRAVSGVAPGPPWASDSGTTSLTLPTGLAGGTYYIIAHADAENAIPEQDEGNNVRTRSIVIGADMVVWLDLPAASIVGAPGSPIMVTDFTRNQSGIPVGASTTNFYLSTDTTLDAADNLLGSRAVPALGPGETSTASNSLLLPAGISGDYYIIAKANADGAVPEPNSDNNVAATSRTIRIGADLIVWLDLPAAPGGGQGSIVVTDFTRNESAVPVGASTTSFYLSTDPTLDAADTFLGSRAVPALGPGETSSASNSLTLPAGISGDYYIIAKANADGAVPEVNSGNNTAVTSHTVRTGTDLIVFLDAPGAASPGQEGSPLGVTDTTRNGGALGAGPSTTTFYLSVDGTVDPGDVLLGGRAVPALGPNEASTVTTTFTIPAWLSGTYRVIAHSDADHAVTGLVLKGSEVALVIGTSGPAPSIIVTDSTRNDGAVSVGASTTSFYLSLDGTLDSGDIALGSRAIPGLAPGETATGSTTFTIAAGVAGTYKVIAQSDVGNSVPSIVVESANLVVAAEGSGVSSAPGSTITVTDFTKNDASIPAGPSTTGFFLSGDQVLDSGDIFLGSRAVPALAPGESNTASTSLTLPANAFGTLYIIAKADSPNAVPEFNETNNTAAQPLLIGADLVVRSVSGPAHAGAGMSIEVTDITVNLSGAAAGASTTRLYLSARATFDGSAILLGSRAVPALTAASNMRTTTVVIPAATATGKYYLIAVADADGSVTEADETNNVTVSASMKIGPDLALDALTAPAGAGAGQTITVTETIINRSPAAAGPSTVKFYFSTDATLDASDTLIGSRSVPSIPGGPPHATNSGSTSVTIPDGLAGGPSYILAKADADDVVAEIHEDNNVRARVLQIGPDLVVMLDLAGSSSSAAPGSTITVTDSTKNDSASPAGPSLTRFYLSSDSVLDASDVTIGSRAIAALAPGSTSTASNTLTLPTGINGAYHVIAKANADNAVSEANTDNNVAVSAGIVRIGVDLTVSIDVPGTVANSAAGATVTVSDSTRNESSAPVPASTTKFYLVTGTMLDASAVLLGSRAIPALGPSISDTGSTTLTLPVTAAGTYRIIAKADADDAVVESNEANNVSVPSAAFTIGPDLVTTLDVPGASSTPAAGATISVTDHTRNDAGTAAPASTTKLYLSTMATLDGGAVMVGSRAIPALPAGQSSTGTISFTLPAGQVGTRYLLTKADADNAVVESNENNNVSTAKSISIGPDLIVTIDVPGAVANSAAGATVTVSDWTRSDNSAPTGPSTTKFYLVPGTALDGNAVLLGSRAIPGLGPSTTNTGSTTLTLPVTAAGTYRIIAKADADDAVVESNEANNVSVPSAAFTIGPDLVATLDVPAASATPATGATIAVTDHTRNDAGTAAPASTTKVYLSTTPTLDGSALLVGSRAVPALAAGQSSSGTISFTLPAGQVGTRYLLSRADADNAVVESNESNNVSAAKSITIGADLIVWIDVPGTVGTGGTVTVTDWTRSDNSAPTGSSTTKFYLVPGTALDGNAVLLGSRTIPALGPSTTNTGSTTLTLPAAAAGTYRIIAKADADEAVVEANETNNVSPPSAPFAIGPDLLVWLDVPATSATPAAGATISVTDHTRNDAATAAPGSTTKLYFSLTPTLDASAVLVGTRIVPALTPGQTSTGTITFTIPAGHVGTRYVIARADADGLVEEGNEANNTSAAKSIVIGADLIVSIDVAGSVVAAPGGGVTITVNDATRSDNSAPAGSSTTTFYLVRGTTLDGTAVVLGSRAVPALGPSTTNTGSTTFAIPATAAGTYRIIARADADNAVVERNEDNNLSAPSALFTVGSDLRVYLDLPGAYAQVAAGSTLSISDVTKNEGTGGVSASTTNFYLSTDTALEAGDVPLGSRAVPALAAGVSSSGSTLLTLPSGIAGTYYIIALADADNVAVETNETNNVTTSWSFEIGADLAIPGTTVPARAGAGTTVYISDVTKNRGGAAAAASTTSIYLSTDAVVDSGDVLLGSRPIGPLSAGIYSSATTAVVIPANTPSGSYFVIVEADTGGVVAESSETNNAAAKPMDVLPDLKVTVLTAPSKAFPGTAISVSDTTVNLGAAAGLSTTSFFLSADATLDDSDAFLTSRAVPALAVNESSTGSVSVAISAEIPGGTYYIIAWTDSGGVIPEVDETNNTRAKTLTIGPDLVVSTVTAPSSAAVGATIVATDATTNRGSAAPDSTTKFYLSVGTSRAPGDPELGSRSVPALGFNATSSSSTPLTIPAGTAPGNYYIIAECDGTSVVTELTETNNTKAKAITITP